MVVDLRLMGSGADRDRSGGGTSEAVSSELDGRGINQLAADIDLSVVTSDIDDTTSAIPHIGDFTARQPRSGSVDRRNTSPKERLCGHPQMGKGRSDLPTKAKQIMG